MRAFSVTLLLVLCLGACKSKETAAPEPEPAAPAAPEEKAPEPPPETNKNFDAFGALIASDNYVVGVRMPRGAELFRQHLTEHVYRVFAPVDRVLTYFGPLLITGQVERQGEGAVYRNASVRGAEISPTKVNVSIMDVGGGYTRIAITEVPPPPKFAPSQDETLKRARQEFRRLD